MLLNLKRVQKCVNSGTWLIRNLSKITLVFRPMISSLQKRVESILPALIFRLNGLKKTDIEMTAKTSGRKVMSFITLNSKTFVLQSPSLPTIFRHLMWTFSMPDLSKLIFLAKYLEMVFSHHPEFAIFFHIMQIRWRTTQWVNTTHLNSLFFA